MTVTGIMTCCYIFTAFWVGSWRYYTKEVGYNTTNYEPLQDNMYLLFYTVAAPVLLPIMLLSKWTKYLHTKARAEHERKKLK